MGSLFSHEEEEPEVEIQLRSVRGSGQKKSKGPLACCADDSDTDVEWVGTGYGPEVVAYGPDGTPITVGGEVFQGPGGATIQAY
mmetsp:Transcript_23478/g.43254  ORF Transcript_23478/g.43254 Transcript_23478/m.43254 type:complete len:84 (-) Transcript_23478:130-381(-)